MQYTIKAIPTLYSGTLFRSRLEARWAAFFDLAGWQWDYEPFDLDGWAPDLKIKTVDHSEFLCEIKPISISSHWKSLADAFKKTKGYEVRYPVRLLGLGPESDKYGQVDLCLYFHGTDIRRYPAMCLFQHGEFGFPTRAESDRIGYSERWSKKIAKADAAVRKAWRTAGNRVQWQKPEGATC